MSFKKLKINPKLVKGLKLLKIITPTPIQEKSIPLIKTGRDVVGQSLTGSGKTAAFGIPILEKVVPGEGIQALILTPTRELCVQVRDSLELYAKFLPINIVSIYGGVGYFQQVEQLNYAEIVVATPGRLIDHLNKQNLSLRKVRVVVLDEADRMLDMGFEEDVTKIIHQTPKKRQTIMFSATIPKSISQLIKKHLKNPVTVQDKLFVDKSLLKQIFFSVKRTEKFSLLVHLLKNKTKGQAIVFCGTKRETDWVAKKLRRQKVSALPVHGDLTQGKRQYAVNSFKKLKLDVLVATDVAARGLDIKSVSHVYNYNVPKTPEDYTHRIGRTARAGKKGEAITLLSEKEFNDFNKILKKMGKNITQETLPLFEKIDTDKTIPKKRQKNVVEKKSFNKKVSKTNKPKKGEKWFKGVPMKNSDYLEKELEKYPDIGKNCPNYEATPRTNKPLFPSSHYNPNFKEKKVTKQKRNAEEYFKKIAKQKKS